MSKINTLETSRLFCSSKSTSDLEMILGFLLGLKKKLLEVSAVIEKT